jgi:methionyl-tRNA formyltransferase
VVDIPADIIVATRSSIYSDAVLAAVANHPNIRVVGIVNSTRLFDRNGTTARGGLKLLQQSGLAYTQYLARISYPRFANFGLHPWQTSKQWADALSIPYLDSADVNSSATVDFMQKQSPEFILTAHFNQILKAPVLDNRDWNAINLHPSVLPTYRGVDPVFAAMLQGEAKLGVTVHRTTKDIDQGEIYAQQLLERDDRMSLFENNLKLFQLGANMICDIAATRQPFQKGYPQPTGGFGNGWPTPQQVHEFLASGWRLI